jgi:hypothetical protein
MKIQIALAALFLFPAAHAFAGVHDDSVRMIRQKPAAAPCEKSRPVLVVVPGSNPDPSIDRRVIRFGEGKPCLPADPTHAALQPVIPDDPSPSGTNDDSI